MTLGRNKHIHKKEKSLIVYIFCDPQLKFYKPLNRLNDNKEPEKILYTLVKYVELFYVPPHGVFPTTGDDA